MSKAEYIFRKNYTNLHQMHAGASRNILVILIFCILLAKQNKTKRNIQYDFKKLKLVTHKVIIILTNTACWMVMRYTWEIPIGLISSVGNNITYIRYRTSG